MTSSPTIRIHREALLENSARNHGFSGGLPVLLGYLVDHSRPPQEIGYRIAAPSRLVVRLGAGFVWHGR